MKAKTIGLWTLMLLFASCSTTRTTEAKIKDLQHKVESKKLTFYLSHCRPEGINERGYNADAMLKINNDHASADLPFHSKLYIKQEEKDAGPITFNGPVKEYSATQKPDKSWDIWFKVSNDKYTYQVNMQIPLKGETIVVISSDDRTNMYYYGEID